MRDRFIDFKFNYLKNLNVLTFINFFFLNLRHEFLAVRNPEGGFYICQAYQNIHQKSSKIKIRWFTDLPHDVFQPDFFDTTG